MRAPAPRWQVASPAVPSVPVFSSVAPGAYMTGRPWARS
jgi:hypothetical protein